MALAVVVLMVVVIILAAVLAVAVIVVVVAVVMVVIIIIRRHGSGCTDRFARGDRSETTAQVFAGEGCRFVYGSEGAMR